VQPQVAGMLERVVAFGLELLVFVSALT
jgi:hypothetical protein